jgi:cell division septation protein DedD
MLRSARDEEMEAEGPRKDVELTLGPAILLAFVCTLLLLCAVCFGVGYTAGRRNGSQMIAAKVAATGQTLAQQATNLQKPTATVAPPAAQAASSASPADAIPASAPQLADKPSAQTSASALRPAIASPTSSAQDNSSAATSSQVQPALPSAAAIMVQIAAVSHIEDANVLMAALRKRGYAVTARREIGDNLIHVQVGPFADRADANSMSQRLLNDGYNAVVLP